MTDIPPKPKSRRLAMAGGGADVVLQSEADDAGHVSVIICRMECMNYPIDPEALWCTVCRKPIPDGQEFVSISIAREAFIPDDRTYSPVFHGVIAQYHISCVPRVVTLDISAHLETS